jgi:hypothetical protein
MKYTLKLNLLLLLFLFVLSSHAQRMGYKEITEKRIEFISPRMSLNARESEKFWPLYREFYDRREEISRKSKEKNQQKDNQPPMTDEDFRNAIRFQIDSKMDQATLMREYTQKYLEILPPEKVYRLLQLEDEFNRVLLNQLKESGPGRREPEPERKRPPF